MSSRTGVRPAEILLVEDNPGDAQLAREALNESKFRNTLHHVTTGDAAMEFVERRGAYADAVRPDLILLDLNLPGMDGREVLRRIKADEDLRRIPVVILTTSDAEEDVEKTYGMHANCYITKPIDFRQFVKVVRSIEDFWLSIVVLPSGD